MKKINPLGIDGYEFNELSEEAQEKAITEHINFWMNVREYDGECPGNYEKAIDKAENMQTPWFLGSYIWEYCKDEIIEEIEINNYLFDEDGELLPITNYVDNSNNVFKMTYQLTKNKEIEIQLV